jgi:hypothetical protein
MQPDFASLRTRTVGNSVNLIAQLTQKIEKLSPAEREAVSAELQALKSCIDSLIPFCILSRIE